MSKPSYSAEPSDAMVGVALAFVVPFATGALGLVLGVGIGIYFAATSKVGPALATWMATVLSLLILLMLAAS